MTQGLTFDSATHTYRHEGEPVPNVTTLIHSFGLIDYSQVPKARLEYKKVLGMAVDYACDLWDRDNLDETTIDERIRPYFEGYKKFRELSGFEPDLDKSQRPLYSKKWRFAGTNDLLGTLDGKTVIIDRKCTWVVYVAGGPQTYAYKMLAEENYGLKISRRFALKLNPQGNFDPIQDHEFKDPNDEQDFKACLWLYHQKLNKYKTLKEIE